MSSFRVKTAIFVFVSLLCTVGFCAEHEAESEPNVFSGTWADAFWAVLSFVILLVVLKKLAWKPILSGLQMREDHIRSEIAEAEKTHKQAESTLAEYNSKLSRADEEGQELARQRINEAQSRAAEIIERAENEAKLARERAEDQIRRASLEARQSLWGEAGDIVLELGGELLGRAITKEDNQRLIDDAINKLKVKQNGQV